MSFEDDQRFEHELKRALRAEDPGDAFTQRVLNRLKTDDGDVKSVSNDKAPASPDRKSTAHFWHVALPLAASLAIAVGGTAWLQHARYVDDGQRARAQVLTALRLTSEKLNVVRSAVLDTQEENRR
jgi:hypothetical protein